MSVEPRVDAIRRLWPRGRPLIGMVHLLALPGSPGWGGSMNAVLTRALDDVRALTEGGMDGVLVENYLDVPFFPGAVQPETVAALTRVVGAVVARSEVPVGVNVLRNDARSALGIAVACDASFIRVNVHTGIMWTDQGQIEGRAADTLRLRRALASDVAIFADVHVKHATPPPGQRLEAAAADTWYRGLADVLVVSGSATGDATATEDVRRARAGAPEAPVLVGSGVNPQSVATILDVADGAIVGTSLTRAGRAGTGIDMDRVRALVRAAGSHRA
ncbi:MAG: BtpA/SgcQ family protein [Gemmatimonadetes bacterium]|nr:BtpA/SgcQ family protein [Gemmatimonadota bacterium]